MIKKAYLISCLFVGIALCAQQSHTVVKGDNPYNISKKYGMSLQDLLQMNPKFKEGKLAIGDVLKVKTSSKSSKNNTATIKTEKTTTAVGKIILQPKQTIYGITKQYKIGESELRRLNPDLESKMKIGEEITLPLDKIKKYADKNAFNAIISKSVTYTDISDASLEKENTPKKVEFNNENKSVEQDDQYATHSVEQGETVFSILNKYGVTMNELVALNPSLSDGLKPGMVLKIKKLEKAYTKKNNDALNVVIMLPFGYENNDKKYRNMALDFLTGAKIAIERNAERGQKLDIKIVDSGNEATFKNALTQINTENTDLIIGPFFKSNILETLEFTKKSKIPVVAPFANSEDLYAYSNLIMAETTEETFADKIIEEVLTVFSNQKIYIVADTTKKNANYIKQKLENKLNQAQIFIVNNPSELVLDKNMMTGQNAPIIAILANDKTNTGEEFSSKIIALSKETQGIRAFSMFAFPSFDKYVDELSQANLVYLIDRKINQEGSFEKEILSDYKNKYCKIPGKYAIIGFDIVNDMLSRENSKGEIFKQINKTQTQLATKFEFEKTKSGSAYINTGFRMMKLIP